MNKTSEIAYILCSPKVAIREVFLEETEGYFCSVALVVSFPHMYNNLAIMKYKLPQFGIAGQ